MYFSAQQNSVAKQVGLCCFSNYLAADFIRDLPGFAVSSLVDFEHYAP